MHQFGKASRNAPRNIKRTFSYHSYCIPKEIHLKNKNFARIHRDSGHAGEDAYFTFKYKKRDSLNQVQQQKLFIGVADGVGNLDPAEAKKSAKFAQQLLETSKDYLANNIDQMDDEMEADIEKKYLNVAHKVACFSSNHVTNELVLSGTSTFCLVAIESQDISESETGKPKLSMLHAWNLGDSGLCIFRKNLGTNCYERIYQSFSQLQGIAIPYQIGSCFKCNTIDDGYGIQHELRSFDVVVVGSDGIWDNLFDDEIETILTQATQYYEQRAKEKNIQFQEQLHLKIVNGHLTQRLIKEALQNSKDRKKSTPWSTQMTDQWDMIYSGGKPDDITCGVVYIH